MAVTPEAGTIVPRIDALYFHPEAANGCRPLPLRKSRDVFQHGLPLCEYSYIHFFSLARV